MKSINKGYTMGEKIQKDLTSGSKKDTQNLLIAVLAEAKLYL
tara:strand:- start:63 stop:188 length:126 start_codon:yes stop_codon:yes gene_type:complete